ncbi:D-xylonate dehydratase [Halalkalicoccus paucihalophilus]|uniref:D-xylonate dehydratase n=1 Tax=Halalkalicoccus paucihalophilus TaxID=1008153 RepID=A0A151ABG5_9EURY|nr:mandelate racemase/muconate lactonizing enzyme family protein [Halalkalicoccus paucihalophilus]KYH24934.1 D-xylonate dehydratase [Halalkalicoccus paucihalophilus]
MRDYSKESQIRATERNVEITGLETCVIEGNFDWNIVEIHTDAGVIGIGESYRGGAIAELMHYIEDVLIGENPLDVERLFRLMVQELSGHGGTTGKVVTAASGIEIALWDTAGKLLGVPVYQLLGGKYRDAVRIYCDCHAGEAYSVEHGSTDYSDAYAPAAYAETAEEVIEQGFTALKFDLDTPIDNDPDPVNGRLSNAAIEHKVETVAAIRDAIGDRIDLAFDCHWDYNLESGKRLARKLEPYDLMWLEDVLPPENTRAQRELARSTSVPLATGENRFRVHEFAELISEFGVDILTPDTSTCGGLAETKAIANRAEEQYIPVSPHNVCSPIGTMANVHLGAAVPNFDVLEYHALEVDWWDDLLTRSDPLIEDGYIEVPEAPGLGVELDKDVAEPRNR